MPRDGDESEESLLGDDDVEEGLKEKPSIRVLINKKKNETILQALSEEDQDRQDVLFLELVIRRLGARMDKMHEARGTHRKLHELHTLVTELSSIQGLSFEIVQFFVDAVESVKDLHPIPTIENLKEFSNSMKKVRGKEVQIKDGLSKAYHTFAHMHQTALDPGLWQDVERRAKQNVSNEEVLAASLEVKQKSADMVLKITTQYKQFPLLFWVAANYAQQIRIVDDKDRTNLYPFGMSFKTLGKKHDSDQPLEWAKLGTILCTGIEDGDMHEQIVSQHVGSSDKFRDAVHEIHSTVMPRFQQELVELKAVLESKLANTQTGRTKAIAAVTAFAFASMQFIMKYLGHRFDLI